MKEKLKAFWTDMQQWIGGNPTKSAVLAGVCFLLGLWLGSAL